MKVLHVQNVPILVINKLKVLFILLQDVQSKYELAADIVSDKALKKGLWGLAQECHQYANELGCQIQSLGINHEELHSFTENSNHDVENLLPGFTIDRLPEFTIAQDIWTYFSNNELKILKAYRQVLNDSDLNDWLRKMIRYQFNGLLFIFLQIKLLKD